MKKMKKILVALAAITIIMIGATTTVNAANVSRWEGNEKEGYIAYNENDERIIRGWAKSDSGRWYYFANGEMTTNRIITYAGETYYVGSDGAMVTGWILFTKDDLLNYNGVENVLITNIFGNNVGTGKVFDENDERYEKIWCYFDETGKMIKNSWIKVDDIWYYIDNVYCLIDEKSILLDYNGNKNYYGFGKSGCMFAGWIANVIIEKSEIIEDAPYAETPTDVITTNWYYYNNDGTQVLNGWKQINKDWFYFDNGIALSDTYLTVDNRNFYFDKSCYMSTGTKILTNMPTFKEAVDNTLTVTTPAAISVSKDNPLTLTFDKTTGVMNFGIINDNYYENFEGNKYSIKIENDSNNIIVSLEEKENKIFGQKWNDEFLYIYKNDNNEKIVNYFINGKMIRSEVLFFGNKILVFNKDGNLITSQTKIDGINYSVSNEYLDESLGIYFSKN